MGWGDSGNIVTTNLDAGTDKPALARSDIKVALNELANVINGRGASDGVASLDSTGRIPFGQLQLNIGTAFPAVTDEAYGYRFYRTDLGEWFTLMDATVWSGTGNAWVGDSTLAIGFGLNSTTGIFATKALKTYGSSGDTSSTKGIHLDVDMMIVACSFGSGQSMSGTARLNAGATNKVSISLVTQVANAMGRDAASWQRVSSGDVMNADVVFTAGTFDDVTMTAVLRRVIDAT